MIRVLLVDDSPMALHILQRLLSLSPDIQVVGTAANGREAFDLLPQLNPGVICTDLHMPVMDGLEFTRLVMNKYPRPILVVSVSVEADSVNAFQLLEAGAVDVYSKPRAILEADQEKLTRGSPARFAFSPACVCFVEQNARLWYLPLRACSRYRHMPPCASSPSALRPVARRPCTKSYPVCRPASRCR